MTAMCERHVRRGFCGINGLRGPPVLDFHGFMIDVQLSEMSAGDFRIELPDMKINGRVVKIPPIDFKRFQRVEIMAPLNC